MLPVCVGCVCECTCVCVPVCAVCDANANDKMTPHWQNKERRKNAVESTHNSPAPLAVLVEVNCSVVSP